MKIALLDHFDSFTYNLRSLCRNAVKEADIRVFQPTNELWEVVDFKPDLLVIGPGPGKPRDYKKSREMVAKYLSEIPIFAVCLGMQMVNEHLGGKTLQSKTPQHGMVHKIEHFGGVYWKDIPSEIEVMRYHSLCVEPAKLLKVEATSQEDSLVMALSSNDDKFFGVQYHPDSFVEQHGLQLIRNFIDAHL